jgi:hypothetical protein
MAQSSFKVRRDLLVMKGASFSGGASAASTFTVGGAASLNSTACVAGAASFDSTIDVSSTASLAAVSVGTAGTRISDILVGSGTMVFGALNASATSSTCLTITGLTQAHKVFLTASNISGSLQIIGIGCSPGGGLLTISVINQAAETYAGGTDEIAYLAIKETT